MKKTILAGIVCALMLWVGTAKAVCTAECTAASPPVPRYIENGDGTVSDACTGLQWEKKTLPGSGGLHDVNNKYFWSANDGQYAPNGTVFTQFLFGLNNGQDSPSNPNHIVGCFGLHCDWRLPQYTELVGIVDQSVCVDGNRFNGSACIDPAFGPTQPYPFGNNDVSSYWSSTGIEGQRTITANVDFFDGFLVGGDKRSIPDYARAVRCNR